VALFRFSKIKDSKGKKLLLKYLLLRSNKASICCWNKLI